LAIDTGKKKKTTTETRKLAEGKSKEQPTITADKKFCPSFRIFLHILIFVYYTKNKYVQKKPTSIVITIIISRVGHRIYS